MKNILKFIGILFGAIIVLFVGFIAFCIADAPKMSNGIVNYRPASFTEIPSSEPFFFSIGKKLKFGNTISEDAPTVFEGEFMYGNSKDGLTWVFVSPDQKKAAITSKGKLYLAEAGKPTILVLNNVRTGLEDDYKAGEIIYDPFNIQWDAHSSAIFIKQDIKPPSMVSPTSHNSKLVRIDITDPKKVVEVVPDFYSWHYFLVGDNDVCFDYSQYNAGIVWKCSHDGISKNVRSFEENSVTFEDGTSIKGSPFLSYNFAAGGLLLTQNGFSLRQTPDFHTELYSKNIPDKPIFSVEGDRNYRDGMSGGSALPNGKYAVLYMLKGEVLIDGTTGKYKELPPNTRVFRNLNTAVYKDPKINLFDINSVQSLQRTRSGAEVVNTPVSKPPKFDYLATVATPRGQQLRKALDQAYKKLSNAPSLPSPKNANLIQIVKKYIPLGTSLLDADKILGSAGFILHMHPSITTQPGKPHYNSEASIGADDKDFLSEKITIFLLAKNEELTNPDNTLVEISASAEKPVPSFEEWGKQLRAELDREYKKLSDRSFLLSGGTVEIGSIVRPYISMGMPLADAQQILQGAGFKINYYTSYQKIDSYYYADVKAEIEPRDKDFNNEKINIFLSYTNKSFKDPKNTLTGISAIALAATTLTPNASQEERGKQLHEALDKEYKKMDEANTLPGCRHTDVDLASIVKQYIPVGASLADAEQVLQSAGYKFSPSQDPDMEGHCSVDASMNVHHGFLSDFTIGISLSSETPTDCKNISKINAALAPVCIDW